MILKGAKILIIDKNHSFRKNLMVDLAQKAATIEQIPSPQLASLEQIEKFQPNIVLVDPSMDHVNGPFFIGEIPKMVKFPPKIIPIMDSPDDKIEQSLEPLEIEQPMIKSSDNDELVGRVSELWLDMKTAIMEMVEKHKEQQKAAAAKKQAQQKAKAQGNTPAKGNAKKSDYDPRVVKCFVKGAMEVISFYVGQDPTVIKPKRKEEKVAKGYVTGRIEFRLKSSRGSMSITLSKEFLPILAEKVFFGNEVNLDDQTASDLAGEMCNQVLGKTKLIFEKLGIHIRIGLPEFSIGEGHVIDHKINEPVVEIGLVSKEKEISIEFTMGAAELDSTVEAEVLSSEPDVAVGVW